MTAAADDDKGNLTRSRDDAGHVVDRTYTTADQIETEAVYLTPDTGSGPGDPQITHYVYDAENHLAFIVSPEGRVTQNIYYNNTPSQRIYDGLVYAQIRYTNTLYTGAIDLASLNAWFLAPTTDRSSAEAVFMAGPYLGYRWATALRKDRATAD